jgi:hypothetical protein
MSRLGRLLVWFWIAVAVWISDRWAWTLPALGGVIAGVTLSRMQQKHREKGAKGLPPFEMSSLLIMLLISASFVYLYVMFLLFELGREEGHALVGLAVGFVIVSLIFLGLGTVVVLKLKVPGWLSRLWDWLLEER